MEKAFFKINEVAKIIGLGTSLTYRLVAEGKIPSVWLAGCRSRRVPRTSLDAWIKAQSEGCDIKRFGE
ncbi:MAG: helix-turn-helix transcriptional regulator [Fimbriimonas sp.]